MSIPEMTPVSSSNVLSVGYSVEDETVYVRFISGNSLYAYRGVPVHEFDNLLTATSVGSYLNRCFKNIYPYERIE